MRKFTLAVRKDTEQKQEFFTFDSWQKYADKIEELKKEHAFVQEHYLSSIVLTERVSLKEALK